MPTSSRFRPSRARLGALALLAALVAGACDDGDGEAGDGAEDATTTTVGEEAAEPEGETDDPASYTKYQELDVEPGGAPVSAATAIAAGERHGYGVEVEAAGTGEQLAVDLTSVDGSTVAAVYGPGGTKLGSGPGEVTVDLDEPGTYVVVVGAAAEATYELKVSLTVDAS